ncbi:MAG TPA: CHAD domain-containing protein [Anaerolineae bacterium]|nr:CHAD domain-containing protein [Anaerolineae bacterium]
MSKVQVRRQRVVEIEAKYCIPDEGTFQRLLETTALAGFEPGPWSAAVLHDDYQDTAAWTLRSRGYACRLRRKAGRYRLTIKGLGEVSGAVHRRIEHEADLPGPLPPREWPPGPARDLVLRLIGDRSLHSLFQIEQTRHNRILHRAGLPVIQLSLDRGELLADGAALSTFLELEAELLPAGREADLTALSRTLEDRWGLQPQPLSKFERGLRALLDAKPGITPDDPMSKAGRKVLRLHYRRMLYHEPGARLGEDIEALHDMRVATRRMRAAFRVFGDAYRRPALRPLLKGLKRTGRALGAVRDLDVFLEDIHAYRDALPPARQNDLDPLLTALGARRQAARARMIAYLDKKKYARFKDRFGRFVLTEGLGSRPVEPVGHVPPPYRVRHVAPLVIYRRWAAVRAYDEWVRIPNPPLERLHALRIACKMLRYTLEFFREVLGPPAKPAIKQVVAMQDHLGAMQDAVVAGAFLRAFLDEGVGGPGAADYLAAREAGLQRRLEAFPALWTAFNGPELGQLIAQSVAQL